ncbi:hypothetical protein RQP46_004868 [Phenoliferia psychrophenolica]
MQGPGKCEYIIADLGSKAGCDALVAEVKKRTDVLHILVNNSGTTWGAPYDDFPEASGWDRVLSTNVKAIFYSVYPSKMSAFGFTNGGDAKLAAYHPMGRVGAAEDIGGLLLFLVARSGAHVTGQHIETDGGARIASRASNL